MSATVIFSLILFIILVGAIIGLVYYMTNYKHEKSSKWGKDSKKKKFGKGGGKKKKFGK